MVLISLSGADRVHPLTETAASVKDLHSDDPLLLVPAAEVPTVLDRELQTVVMTDLHQLLHTDVHSHPHLEIPQSLPPSTLIPYLLDHHLVPSLVTAAVMTLFALDPTHPWQDLPPV